MLCFSPNIHFSDQSMASARIITKYERFKSWFYYSALKSA